jgi:hypothetical protein
LRALLEEKIFPQIINFYGLWVFFLKAAQIVKKKKNPQTIEILWASP